MSDRLAEEHRNDRLRPKIGVTQREKVRGTTPTSRSSSQPALTFPISDAKDSDQHTMAMLADETFRVSRDHKIELANLTRFDMVKSRLW